MKTARVKTPIKTIETGMYTYNRHFLEKGTTYEVISEQSSVMGFPYILIHPKLKNIMLVSPAGIVVMDN